MKIKDMFTIGLLIGMIPYYLKKLEKLINKDKPKMKILFVLKSRQNNYGDESSYSYGGMSSGLANSISFIHEMLHEMHIKSKVSEVIDGNGIDKEIHLFKPDIVIVEALFVTPTKMKELKHLHKNTRFYVRLHSNPSFLAQEGIASMWIFQYLKDGVHVTANSPVMRDALELMTGLDIPLTTNYYPLKRTIQHINHHGEVLNFGCFSAVRVLKNQYIQALASIAYCIKHGKKLRFHINGGDKARLEGPGADPVLKNLRELFKHYEEYDFHLIEHGWKNHHDFLKLMQNMDICMQVSLNESFNIVVCDGISQNIPICASEEVPFLPKQFCANPTDIHSIIKTIDVALHAGHRGVEENFQALAEYNSYTMKNWKKFLNIN